VLTVLQGEIECQTLRRSRRASLTLPGFMADNMGYLNDDGNNAFKKPRGIMACRLSNGAFTSCAYALAPSPPSIGP
jgi:hypothetical protein